MPRYVKPMYSPGTLLYFGGAVHEVLDDGRTTRVRNELTPGSDPSLWRPKFAKKVNSHRYGSSRKRAMRVRAESKRKWVQRALKYHKRGALHRDMGISEDKTIPFARLEAHIRVLKRQLARASGKRRERVRTKLRRAYLGRTLKRRNPAFRKMSLAEGRRVSMRVDQEGRRMSTMMDHLVKRPRKGMMVGRF